MGAMGAIAPKSKKLWPPSRLRGNFVVDLRNSKMCKFLHVGVRFNSCTIKLNKLYFAYIAKMCSKNYKYVIMQVTKGVSLISS